jgi:hypothetical protein
MQSAARPRNLSGTDVKVDAATVAAYAKANGFGFIEAARKLSAMDGQDAAHIQWVLKQRQQQLPTWLPAEDREQE